MCPGKCCNQYDFIGCKRSVCILHTENVVQIDQDSDDASRAAASDRGEKPSDRSAKTTTTMSNTRR